MTFYNKILWNKHKYIKSSENIWKMSFNYINKHNGSVILKLILTFILTVECQTFILTIKCQTFIRSSSGDEFGIKNT